MTGMEMAPTLPFSSIPMMLPSAVPAIARRARERDGVLAAPPFTGSYLCTWALVALAMCVLYRPGGRIGVLPAGALVVGAGLYELTPLKRECRRRAASASARACGSASTALARASG